MCYQPKLLLLVFCLIGNFPLFGQLDFREGYERENPAPLNSGLSAKERLAIHQKWLKEAEGKKDTQLQIFGEIYLFYDYMGLNDLPVASSHILKAEYLAKRSGKVGWRGGIAFRKGQLHTYMREPDKQLITVKDALEWCTQAGDSLCVAESLESLSSAYGYMDSFDLAHHYFGLALPMIRKFGERKHLKTAMANYGNLLISEGKPAQAIAYQEEAKAIAIAIEDDVSLGKAINNLANAHRLAGNTTSAIQGFEEAIAHNKKIGNYRSVVHNYAGLRQCYQAIGDYKSAIAYQEKYYELQDSLIGSTTKIRIAELETQLEESEQALALEISQRALLVSNQRVERREIYLLVLLCFVLIAGAFWRWQSNRQSARILKTRRNLVAITKQLKEKNEVLSGLKDHAASHIPELEDVEKIIPKPDQEKQEADIHLNLFDQSILTNTDWTDFKVYFDDSFPGFVQRLRAMYPAMTEAEERLFLLLKLNLTSKEISNILGISVSGVKKTRNRLRKKLLLTPQDSLEAHVQAF